MKRKLAAVLLGAAAFAMLLSGCGENEATEAVNESTQIEKEGTGEAAEGEENAEEEAEETAEVVEEPEEPALKVGVLFPDDEGKWADDGLAIKAILEETGYEPLIFSAENNSETQTEQIQELVDAEVSALIIAPADAYALTDVLFTAEEKEIPVFSYDTLIMDTDAVDYYVTFDARAAGRLVGENIVKLKDLEKAREEKTPVTIEFFMGAPEEISGLFFYNGILEVLQEYFDDGTLVCKSGRTAFDDASVMRWSESAAKNTLKNVIAEFYQEEGAPDIICTASDKYTYGMIELLEGKNMTPEDENWPLITGCGSEAKAVKNAAEGKIAFTLLMDRKELAEACVKMTDTYLSGEKPEVKDYAQYDNGKKIIGTDTCEAQIIDKDNYQMLIDNGMYSAEEIVPEEPVQEHVMTALPEEEETEAEENGVTPTPEA